MKEVRTNEYLRRGVCPVCYKQFSQRSSAWRHLKTHTGHRPHHCNECGQGFIQKYNLLRHVPKCKGPREQYTGPIFEVNPADLLE